MEIGVLLVGWGWTFDEMHSGWSEIERLGFDLCYLGDDLFPHPQIDCAVYDPWTLLPAMATTTTRMRIGSLVSPAGRRHPGLFAKMTTGTDLASNGRLVVGMGAGNAPEQQHSLHQPYLGPAERTQLLHEELTVLRSMWTTSRTTFDGRFYQTTDAVCEPKAARSPHPDVLIALKNAKLLAPVAGEFANRVNLLGNDDEQLGRLVQAVCEHATSFGRDASQIVMGRLFQVLFTEDDVPADDMEAVLERHAFEIGIEPAELINYHQHVASYVGPAAGAAEVINARTHELGLDEAVIVIDTVGKLSYERTMAGLRTFASDVMPSLNSAT